MESLLSWRRLCFLLIAILVSLFTFLYLSRTSDRFSPLSILDLPQYQDQIWTSTPTTPFPDLHNEALTTAQCEAEFPDLYYEVDRAVAYWNDHEHTISQQDVNISWRQDAAARILIHDNELRILETKGVQGNKGYRVRMLSVLSQIQRALWSASSNDEQLPTIEAAIVVDDMSLLGGGEEDTRSLWTFTSNKNDISHQRHWLIPDFSLLAAPSTGSFADMRRRAQQYDALFIDKTPKAVWRGVQWTNEGIRGSLLNETRGKAWADVEEVNWETGENIMAMDEHCEYAFTIHTEGRSYSGRLPFLLNCDSVPIIHSLDWTTHFYHLLTPTGPHQNFIQVQRDFTDLEPRIQHLLAHPQAAQQIIANSIATFRNRYTTPAATTCYLRRLIAGYASAAFTPEVVRRRAPGAIARRRGVAFEEFVLWEEDYGGDGEAG